MSKIELPTITSGYNLSTINNNFQKIEDALNKEVLYRKGYLGEPNEMQTNLDMNGKQILNVVTGSSPSDLATRGYVDEEIAEERVYVDQQLGLVNSELGTKYDKTGGPVFGDINLNGHKLIGASEVQASKTSTSILEINGVPVVPGNSVIDPYNGTREALRRSYAKAGYNLVAGSFEVGGTLVNHNDVLLQEVTGKAFSGPTGTVAAGTDPNIAGFVDVSLITPGATTIRENGRFALANIVFALDFERPTDTNPIQFIQRAMDYCAANNKDLCISKMYQINAPLVYKGGGFYFPAIYGVGGNSGLQKTTNTTTGATSPDVFGINWDVDAVIVIPAVTNQPKTVVIDRLTISGTDTVTPAYGIFTTKCENLDVTRCLITKVDLGMLDSGSWVSSVEKTVFRRVGSGGYKKLSGTSTYLRRCYVDISAGFGFWVKSGYSGIHDCACDKTSTYSYIVEGQASEATSDVNYLISNCGSENSGSGAPIKVLGAAFTTVNTFTAFNWDQQQVPTPAAFIEIEANYTHVELNNVRYIGVDKFLNEIGQQNVIYITGRTTRTPSIPFGTYQANTKIIEMSRDGVKFSRGADTAGIALTNEDITDGNTNQNWCGLRNKKVVIRGSVNVTRTSGQPYGQATFTIPISLANYHVAASVIAGELIPATTHIPVCTVTKGTDNIVITVVSANGSVAWSSFSVELIISGIRT